MISVLLPCCWSEGQTSFQVDVDQSRISPTVTSYKVDPPTLTPVVCVTQRSHAAVVCTQECLHANLANAAPTGPNSADVKTILRKSSSLLADASHPRPTVTLSRYLWCSWFRVLIYLP